MEDNQLLPQCKILISADSSRLIAALIETLSRIQIQIRLTGSEQAILAYNEWTPDLIIVDLRTQLDRGIARLVQLKSIVPDANPILALTERHAAALRQEALMHGVKDVLALPCEAAEALARVRNLLELRRLSQHLEQPYATMTSPGRHRSETLDQDVHSDLCQRLARLVAYRDPATGTHAMRMSRYSAALARAAGLSAAESELLRQASPLHDIGKIAIPDRILLKPAPLEPEEWSMMQAHTTIGAELLTGDDSALLRTAYDTALTHHEKWDGSGYPQGLRGEAIPFVGRITAICDVFDALTSVRPYKPAWPVQDAVAAICQQVGHHFEPQLVKQFCTILPELLAIKEQYADLETTVCLDDARRLQQGEVVRR
jgi:putative two-component system response regulator